MKTKQIIKISIDVVMTIVFFICMAYHLTSETLHEWLGFALFTLFIVHHLLNLGWYKALFKGKYSPLRLLHTTINTLLLVAMIGMIASGVMLSHQLFSFLNLSSGILGRKLHMLSCSWGFVLMAAHLGFHWGMVIGILKKKQIFVSKVASVAMPVVSFAVAAYGAYALFERQEVHKMFLLIEFSFLNYGEPFVLFLLDYIAILSLFACATYYLSNALKGRKLKKATE